MNSGRAELDIVAVAQDQATAVLRTVDQKLVQTSQNMQKVAASATTVKDRVDSFKGAISPVDLVREGFNKLRENLGFVGVAIGSVVAVAETLWALFKKNPMLEYALATIDAANASNKLSAAFQTMAKSAREAARDVDALKRKSIETEAQLAELRGDTDKAEYLRRTGAATIAGMDREDLDKELKATQEDGKKLASALMRAAFEAEDAKRKADMARAQIANWAGFKEEQMTAAAGSAVMDTAKISADVALISLRDAIAKNEKKQDELKNRIRQQDELVEELIVQRLEPTPEPRPKGPSGGDKLARDRAAQFAKPYTEWVGPMLEEAIPGLDLMSITLDREAESFGKMVSETDKLTESILRLGEGLAEIANISAPELGGMLSELTSLTERYQAQTQALADKVKAGTISGYEAEKKAAQARTQAIIGSSTAGVAAIAKSIGGLKAEYVVRSIGEAAAAAASYGVGDIAGGTNHALASTLYAVAAGTSSPAAGAGGGGGNATASSRGTPFGGGSGQPMTVVYQFSTLLADEAGVKRATNQVERGLRRTGIGAREAA